MLPVSRKYNQNWIPELFNDFFTDDWVDRTGNSTPAINVIENEHGFELELAAPGMTKEDFKVSLDEEGDLVINKRRRRTRRTRRTRKASATVVTSDANSLTPSSSRR